MATAGVLLLLAPACVSVAPAGMSSEMVQVARELDLPAAAVLNSTRSVLQQRGDVSEQTIEGDRTTFVTGQARIVVEARGPATTWLEVNLQERVGTDHRYRARTMFDAIESGARGGS
ncbi:MAG: hypothetical protein IPM29_27050 [Planctomycetes bacterium]|nr:hypothetical protein [Planctomycetota bacterium]